jgi:sodium ion-translocating decarboxylase beta subunit
LPQTGFAEFFTGGPFPASYVIMVVIGLVFVYLGIAKKWEPLLLVPIGFSIILVNLFPGLMAVEQTRTIEAPFAGQVTAIEVSTGDTVVEGDHLFDLTLDVGGVKAILSPVDGTVGELQVTEGQHVSQGEALTELELSGTLLTGAQPTGLFSRIFYYGIQWEIIPILIFLGLGAMTDFGPLIANPKTLLLGAAAQFGVYFVFFMALFIGFSIPEACSIGIIGGADGPTTVYLTAVLAPGLLAATAPAAYSYMAMVPIIQPPVIKLLTTKEERKIYMKPQLREVSKLERILFPFIVSIVIILLVPEAAPLIGAFMVGNLLLVSGVTGRLAETAGGPFMNILTILLGLAIGGIMTADNFLRISSLEIFGLGLVAFATATAFGVLVAKLMNKFSKEPINPMIGAAGVSAVPMSSRVVQRMGQQENPRNFLLMHAMGPNLAGVIGTITAAGIFLSLVG